MDEYGGRVDDQDSHHFDEDDQVRLRPDIVWKLHGTPLAVADAKYMAEKLGRYPSADPYQLFAYCTVLGLGRGHLLYAKGSGVSARHVVRRSGVKIICQALDLDAEPSAQLDQMHTLAVDIAAESGRHEPSRLRG